MHRMKEMKRENDTLVVKILKLRGLNNNSQKSLMRPGASYRSTNEDSKMKRSGSANSVRSRGKRFGVRSGSYSSQGSTV